jgi:pimeloyl-ACP methyl ester carboxylesterase
MCLPWTSAVAAATDLEVEVKRRLARKLGLAGGITLPVLLAGLGMAGPVSASAGALTATGGQPTPSLAWRTCPTAAQLSAKLTCAFLRVPVDWAHPSGPTITIGLARLDETRPGERLGNLFINPGGPGGAASAALNFQAEGQHYFTQAVLDHYTLIGLDPRGVGLSTRIRCDPALYNQPVSLFPTTTAGFAALVAHNEALGNSCVRLTGPMIFHLDAVQQAYDYDAARRALGDAKLNFLGLSYGSVIGSTYAQLFPAHVGRMVLDGLIDHSVSDVTALADEASTYERELDRFFAWCNQTTACALHGPGAANTWNAVIAKAEHAPLPAPGCTKPPDPCQATVTADDIRFDAEEMLFFKAPNPELLASPGWNGLAKALAAANTGDATALSPARATSTDDPVFAGGVIGCSEFAGYTRTLPGLLAKEHLGQAVAPLLHGATQTYAVQTGCIGWPAPMTNPPHALDVTGTPPILLVNALYDPSTSYTWAVGLAGQMPTGVLVTRDGDGHTSYLLPGTSQTRDAIDRYLLTGDTPPPATIYPN